MSLEMAERIAKAVLYEGYLLYPYYPSSTKNRQRWTFGGVFPEHFAERSAGSSDRSSVRSECLLLGGPGEFGDILDPGYEETSLEVRLRFLQLSATRAVGEESSEEALEREHVLQGLSLKRLCVSPHHEDFEFPALIDRESMPIRGRIEIAAELLKEGLFRLSVRVRNRSTTRVESRREALLHSLVSTHLLFSASEGRFVSQIDPPESCSEEAERCRNEGLWPVLVGQPGSSDLMLAAPIILYDYPQIAPESPGDLFDATEIDEILSLRILTLSEEEKSWIRAGDERGRELLDRTERLTPEQWARLHGTFRNEGRNTRGPDSVRVGEVELRAGSQVRLRPRNPADIFDLALTGKEATIEAIEQDFENQVHLSVTVNDDPGRDLGKKGQPGHRFFFKPEDVEPLE